MADYSEKQQPPVYPAANSNPNQGYDTMAPNIVNVVPPQSVAVTGQQYRDQCK